MSLFHRKDFAFEATFDRMPPAQFVETIGIPLGWIVVHYGHVPAKADRRKAHGELFEISSDQAKIYRMLRFSPNITKGNERTPGSMVIDWIGWIDLHDRAEEVADPIKLRLRRVPWWKLPWAYLKHPDPAIRLSGWLGWLSIMLGVFALLMTLYYGQIGQQLSVPAASVAEPCGGGRR